MHVVIVGGGLAAAKAVEELREHDAASEVTLLAAEPHRPYERPPLSKGVLLGEADVASAYVHDEGWYAAHDVDLRTGARATSVDVASRRVAVAGGGDLPYDRLLLATGAQPRHLPDVDSSGVPAIHLRTIEDSRALKGALHGHVLILGAGWIGLEVASAARQAGARVTVVEPAPLPLAKVLGPEIAPLFAALHREHGVDLRLRTSVAALEHSSGRTTATLSDGTTLTPDLVVVGVGAAPDDLLAREAGLAVDGGVLVDAGLRTSDPAVWAAGDVANHDHPLLGRVRVEHWDTAIHHGQHAARAMLGDTTPYTRQPYFFTDQYDLGMEYVGHVGPDAYDEVVVRGSRADRVLTALWVTDDRVVAGMHLNDWDAIGPIRDWVGQDATDALRDSRIPLAEVEL
jgi:NADPH-dependent 2,4-dienoyl-CoA reductase/sulfur reductase-like enzyme